MSTFFIKFNYLFTANLNPIPTPVVCAESAPVLSSGVYEKSLCYVKLKSTYYNARDFCLKNKMQLYQVKSSAESRWTIFNLAKQIFGGSSKAAMIVDGTQENKCLTYRGDGTLNYDWCTTTYHFVCEFNDQGELLHKSLTRSIAYHSFL
jgi:hypothetical protein